MPLHRSSCTAAKRRLAWIWPIRSRSNNCWATRPCEDLQKLLAWKVEDALKQELEKLIHEATERSIPRLREDIETHLSLALPELLARIAEQSRR